MWAHPTWQTSLRHWKIWNINQAPPYANQIQPSALQASTSNGNTPDQQQTVTSKGAEMIIRVEGLKLAANTLVLSQQKVWHHSLKVSSHRYAKNSGKPRCKEDTSSLPHSFLHLRLHVKYQNATIHPKYAYVLSNTKQNQYCNVNLS